MPNVNEPPPQQSSFNAIYWVFLCWGIIQLSSMAYERARLAERLVLSSSNAVSCNYVNVLLSSLSLSLSLSHTLTHSLTLSHTHSLSLTLHSLSLSLYRWGISVGWLQLRCRTTLLNRWFLRLGLGTISLPSCLPFVPSSSCNTAELPRLAESLIYSRCLEMFCKELRALQPANVDLCVDHVTAVHQSRQCHVWIISPK